ncbi:MAG: hypothetical protein GY874_02495 [Desulfobacteraceae bacterium]|nr:hypothetical protein [Desulfobacteraceae bacterium]
MPDKSLKIKPAPPFITAADSAEAQRIRKLLKTQFSMQEIKAAAKQPPEPKAAPEPKKTPKPKAASMPEKDTGKAKKAKKKPAKIKPIVTTADSVDTTEDEPDPVTRYFKFIIAGFTLIICLLLGASAKNNAKFYIKPAADYIEIWRGNFSPTGKRFFVVLHGVPAPDEIKPVYSRNEVYPLIFNYYLNKADALLDVSGLPDYEEIQKYIYKANDFTVSQKMTDSANIRLDTIERMAILYKADVAFSKDTVESLDAALDYLYSAKKLSTDEDQIALIDKKIAAAKSRRSALEAQKKASEKKASEKKASEKKASEKKASEKKASEKKASEKPKEKSAEPETE